MSVFYQQGRYRGRVTKQAMGETSKGNPQFVLTFLVIGVYEGDDLETCSQSYERSVFRVINENTIKYVLEDLKQLGYTRDSFKFLDPSATNFHNFAGEEYDFVCDHETYEGKDREKWQLARDGSGFEVKPLASDKMRKLDALFGKGLRASAPLASAPRGRAQSSAAVAEDDGPPNTPIDDDVPF